MPKRSRPNHASMPARVPERTTEAVLLPRPRHSVKLTTKETVLMTIYRAISDAERAAVDRVVSMAWTSKREHHTVRNARFSKAFRQLGTEHLRCIEWLTYFANKGRS